MGSQSHTSPNLSRERHAVLQDFSPIPDGNISDSVNENGAYLRGEPGEVSCIDWHNHLPLSLTIEN